jgi:hypothetical protein
MRNTIYVAHIRPCNGVSFHLLTCLRIIIIVVAVALLHAPPSHHRHALVGELRVDLLASNLLVHLAHAVGLSNG